MFFSLTLRHWLRRVCRMAQFLQDGARFAPNFRLTVHTLGVVRPPDQALLWRQSCVHVLLILLLIPQYKVGPIWSHFGVLVTESPQISALVVDAIIVHLKPPCPSLSHLLSARAEYAVGQVALR